MSTAPDLTYRRCPHATEAGVVRPDLCANVIKPWNWRCADTRCATTESLWLCCTCGSIGCGRGVNCHAEKHRALHSDTRRPAGGHCIVMALSDGVVYCYACDEWVLIESTDETADVPTASGSDESALASALASAPRRRLRSKPADAAAVPAAAAASPAALATGGLAGLRALRTRLLSLLAGREAPGLADASGSGRPRAGSSDTAKPRLVDSTSASAPAAPPPLRRLPSYSTAVEAEMLARDREGTADAFHARTLQRMVLAALRRCVSDGRRELSEIVAAETRTKGNATVDAAIPSAAPSFEAGPAVVSSESAADSSAPTSPLAAATAASSTNARGATKRVAAGLIPGRCGLRNMGNTCFLSSVVVCEEGRGQGACLHPIAPPSLAAALARVRRFRAFCASFKLYSYPESLTVTALSPRRLSVGRGGVGGSGGGSAAPGRLAAAATAPAPRASGPARRAAAFPGKSRLLTDTESAATVATADGSSAAASAAVPELLPLYAPPSLDVIGAPPTPLRAPDVIPPPPPSLDLQGLATLCPANARASGACNDADPPAPAYLLPAPLPLARQTTATVYADMTTATRSGAPAAPRPPTQSKKAKAAAASEVDSRPENPALSSSAQEPTRSAEQAVGTVTGGDNVGAAATPMIPQPASAAADASGKRRRDTTPKASAAAPTPRAATVAQSASVRNPYADSIVVQTVNAVRLLFSGRWSVFTPAALVYAVWRRLPQFRSFAQQDAHEFAEALLGALHDECLRGGVPQEAARGLQRKPAPPVNALSTGARLFVLSSPATTSQPPLHLPPALSMPVSHARLAASPGEFSAPTLSLSVAGASTHLLGPAVGAALAAARAAAAGVRSPETASAERPAQPTAGRRLARQRSALGRAAGGTPALQPHPQPPHRAAWPAYTPALRPAPAAGAVAAEAGRDTGLPVLDLEGTGGGAGSSARLSIAPPKPAGLVRTLSDTAPAPSGGGASALTSMAMLRPLLRSPGAPASERVLPQAPQQPAPGPESSSQTSPLSHEPSRASSARVPDAPIALPTHVHVQRETSTPAAAGEGALNADGAVTSVLDKAATADTASTGGSGPGKRKRGDSQRGGLQGDGRVGASSSSSCSTPPPPPPPAAASPPTFDPTLLPRFPQSAALGGVFTGSTLTTVRCGGCGTESRRVEAFSVLSLDLPQAAQGSQAPQAGGRAAAAPEAAATVDASPAGSGPRGSAAVGLADPCFDAAAGLPDRGQPSLLRCLAAFSAPEALAGDSAYHCDVCAAKRPATKAVRLHFLPPALVFHVNRAVWQPRGGGRREKLQTWVAFPLALSPAHLVPFLSDDAREAYAAAAAAASTGSGGESAAAGAWGWEYRLASVVVHQGRGIDTGHYTAFVNETHGGGDSSGGGGGGGGSADPARDTWALVDDHRVSILPSLAELRRAQAYLLVFERVELQ